MPIDALLEALRPALNGLDVDPEAFDDVEAPGLGEALLKALARRPFRAPWPASRSGRLSARMLASALPEGGVFVHVGPDSAPILWASAPSEREVVVLPEGSPAIQAWEFLQVLDDDGARALSEGWGDDDDKLDGAAAAFRSFYRGRSGGTAAPRLQRYAARLRESAFEVRAGRPEDVLPGLNTANAVLFLNITGSPDEDLRALKRVLQTWTGKFLVRYEADWKGFWDGEEDWRVWRRKTPVDGVKEPKEEAKPYKPEDDDRKRPKANHCTGKPHKHPKRKKPKSRYVRFIANYDVKGWPKRRERSLPRLPVEFDAAAGLLVDPFGVVEAPDLEEGLWTLAWTEADEVPEREPTTRVRAAVAVHKRFGKSGEAAVIVRAETDFEEGSFYRSRQGGEDGEEVLMGRLKTHGSDLIENPEAWVAQVIVVDGNLFTSIKEADRVIHDLGYLRRWDGLPPWRIQESGIDEWRYQQAPIFRFREGTLFEVFLGEGVYAVVGELETCVAAPNGVCVVRGAGAVRFDRSFVRNEEGENIAVQAVLVPVRAFDDNWAGAREAVRSLGFEAPEEAPAKTGLFWYVEQRAPGDFTELERRVKVPELMEGQLVIGTLRSGVFRALGRSFDRPLLLPPETVELPEPTYRSEDLVEYPYGDKLLRFERTGEVWTATVTETPALLEPHRDDPVPSSGSGLPDAFEGAVAEGLQWWTETVESDAAPLVRSAAARVEVLDALSEVVPSHRFDDLGRLTDVILRNAPLGVQVQPRPGEDRVLLRDGRALREVVPGAFEPAPAYQEFALLAREAKLRDVVGLGGDGRLEALDYRPEGFTPHLDARLSNLRAAGLPVNSTLVQSEKRWGEAVDATVGSGFAGLIGRTSNARPGELRYRGFEYRRPRVLAAQVNSDRRLELRTNDEVLILPEVLGLDEAVEPGSLVAVSVVPPVDVVGRPVWFKAPRVIEGTPTQVDPVEALLGGRHAKSEEGKRRFFAKFQNGFHEVDYDEDGGRVWYSVAYAPWALDGHGNWMHPADIALAARRFNRDSRLMNLEHRLPLDPKECYLAYSWIQLKDDPDFFGQFIRAGTWMVGVWMNQNYDQKARAGDVNGVSWEGWGAD